jgi:para-aminobenzoate synthetase component 1
MPALDEVIAAVGGLEAIHSERIQLAEPFIDTAARFAADPGTVVLMSGGASDSARYHILAASPWLCFRSRGRTAIATVGSTVHPLCGDPLDLLEKLIETFRPPDSSIGSAADLQPVAAGFFGYLAYDLKDDLETLPRTSVDDLGLPQICLYTPSAVLVHDTREAITRLHVPLRQRQRRDIAPDVSRWFKQRLEGRPPTAGSFRGDPAGFVSTFRRPEYLEAVARIRDYIAAGDVYQVNMSQRFAMDFSGDPFSLFRALYKRNPAPFFAYVNAGDHHIVSTSPERFIRQSGHRLETRPIKGTRPRGHTAAEDSRLRRELTDSRKDDAELSMIVDLLRNDIGKVCAAGTVNVVEHKRVEGYRNVYHLVSVVEGRLDAHKTSVDVIRATFPGGSITGCPKIRSMEIIDELEPVRRHVYTGAIGYIGFHDTMDLSIAIRTATVINDRIVFSVGGGVVYDSDPADEYEETLHKGKTLMAVFEDRNRQARKPSLAWQNGCLKPADQVAIPLADEGLLYGNGFFETLRVEAGRPIRLEAHLARFETAWRRLFPSVPPDLTWADVIDRVIRANSLSDTIAAVKILATRGTRERAPFDYNLMVTATPYIHRLTGKKAPGLALVTEPEPRRSPLADFKTLNYLYYLQAGKRARALGADEALILNPDGSVSETNTASILVVDSQRILLPDSEHVLPGVTLQATCDLMAGWEYAIRRKRIWPVDLLGAEGVILTNALMGAVPVIRLDGARLTPPTGICRRINAGLFDIGDSCRTDPPVP